MEKIGSSPTEESRLITQNFADLFLINSRVEVAEAGQEDLRAQVHKIGDHRMNLGIEGTLIKVVLALKVARFADDSFAFGSSHGGR